MRTRTREGSKPLHVSLQHGPGPTLLVLHGLTGSSASWSRLAPLLAPHRLVIPDLLGFGRSPKPESSSYDLDAHCDALAPLIERWQPMALVAHSMGAVIALGLLDRFPELKSAVLICPALYESREHALISVKSAPLLQRLTLRSTPLAHLVCEITCMLRPILRPLAPLAAPGLPAEVARAGLDHSWPSYSRTLEAVVFSGVGLRLLNRVGCRVHIVAATRDRTVPIQILENVSNQVAALVRLDGDHEILLRQPKVVASAVHACLHELA